jgi:hypothetical protein
LSDDPYNAPMGDLLLLIIHFLCIDVNIVVFCGAEIGTDVNDLGIAAGRWEIRRGHCQHSRLVR